MAVLAVFSNKGGVGKTATVVNLAYLASQAGISTLVCDLDSQSSATFYFGVKPELKGSARGFAKGGKTVLRSVQATAYDNLDILPADISHRNLALAFEDMSRSKRRLAQILEPLQERYALLILFPIFIWLLLPYDFRMKIEIIAPNWANSFRVKPPQVARGNKLAQELGAVYPVEPEDEEAEERDATPNAPVYS